MTAATMSTEGVPAAYDQALPLGQCAALADPELIRQHADLIAWPALIAEWNKLSWGERFGNEPPALPLYGGKPIGSPQMVQRATLDAAGDLDRDVRARLGDGRLRVLAFQEPRQLDAEPVLLPAELVATATAVTWRTGTLEAGGMVFLECRVIPAADLAEPEPEPEPEPVTDPPPTDDRLVLTLADLFAEDQAWETLGPAKLAPIVAQRDRRFRPGNGIWAAATLVDKIKTLKQVAKAEARARGA